MKEISMQMKHAALLMFIFVICLFSDPCYAGKLLQTMHGQFNDFSINPFEGTILNRFTNFRFRQSGDPVNFPEGSLEYVMQHHEPLIFKYFDWVIWRFQRGHMQSKVDSDTPPRSVLIRPTEGKLAAAVLSKLPLLSAAERRLLVIAGDDTHLSEVLDVMKRELERSRVESGGNVTNFLTSRFSDIFIEAKDIPHEHIKTVPMGFTNFYVLQVPHGVIEENIQNAKGIDVSKKQLVFAAWGKVWAILDDRIEDRVQLAQFLELNSTQEWVSRQSLDFEGYWRSLGKYKYSLCPRGNGIQAPKIFEALVLRVVPVVTRVAAYEDLVELGFPILIIDHWEALSPAYLEREYHRRFSHVNWERVLRMISINGVWELLMDGGRYPF